SFQAEVAGEEGYFDIRDVIGRLTEKLIRRHPHVVGDEEAAAAEHVKEKGEAIKERERAEKGLKKAESLLDGVPRFPALILATELQKRAAKVGFDWARKEDVRVKLLEDRKSTRLNSSHVKISYAVFCLKKKTQQ